MPYLAKYGEEFATLVPAATAGAVDFAGSGDWTPAAGDVKVSKDEAAFSNIATLPTAVGSMWKFTLSATEMQAKRITVQIIDSATKAVEDQSFTIQTYGHASAQIKADLDAVGASQQLAVDVGAISGDATAADNLEKDYDGTGYAKTNSTIGTTTTNTDMRGTDNAALATALTTAQNDLDTLTGTDGVTLATTQPNYAPATAAGLATVDANVDAILVDTGTTLPATLTTIEGKVDTVDTVVDAIVVDTAEIGVAGAGLTVLATAANLATVDTVVDAILAMLDDARTEPGQGAPPVNPDLATKIDWLYKAWRNRSTQTSTQYTLYADDATTVDSKATTSDDGTTFDRGEVVTGP